MARQQETLDALELLAQDHRTVEALFEKFENARGEAAQQRIVRQICEELWIHALIAEQIFYPAIRDVVDRDIMDEAQVEHDSAKTLILSLRNGVPSDPYFDAKVSVLEEQVEHHVHEEERQRGSMFAQVRKADIDLVALGEQMTELKTQLQAQARAGSPGRPQLFALVN